MSETNIEPMSVGEAFNLVMKGALCHMYSLDEEGYCAESDEYVVALYVMEDFRETLKEWACFNGGSEGGKKD